MLSAAEIERAVADLPESYRIAMARLALQGYTVRQHEAKHTIHQWGYWHMYYPSGQPMMSYMTLPSLIEAACSHVYSWTPEEVAAGRSL